MKLLNKSFGFLCKNNFLQASLYLVGPQQVNTHIFFDGKEFESLESFFSASNISQEEKESLHKKIIETANKN